MGWDVTVDYQTLEALRRMNPAWRLLTATGLTPIDLRDSYLNRHRTLDTDALMHMLWAEELRALAGIKGARFACMQHARETMTGRQIRQAVCRALMKRTFPRADERIAA